MSKTWDEVVTTWEKTADADDKKANNLCDALFGCIQAVRAEVEQARLEAHTRCRVLESELATAVLRIKALEESVEDLLHGEAGETEIAVRTEEPEIRVRISHAHTLKDGWRCDSTTTEWTGRGEPDWEAIRGDLMAAYLAGRDEADARNRADAQEAKAA